MQNLVQIVRRSGRVQPGPQHPGKHITVSPVAAGESQQLNHRLRLAQPPRARNRAASDTNTEAAQQRNMQRAGTGRHIHTRSPVIRGVSARKVALANSAYPWQRRAQIARTHA